jgi:hypothetical protein
MNRFTAHAKGKSCITLHPSTYKFTFTFQLNKITYTNEECDYVNLQIDEWPATASARDVVTAMTSRVLSHMAGGVAIFTVFRCKVDWCELWGLRRRQGL